MARNDTSLHRTRPCSEKPAGPRTCLERPGAGRPPSPPRKCFRPRAGPSPPACQDTMPFLRHRAGSVARCALLHRVCARERARVRRSVLTAAQGPGRGLWGTTCVCTTHTHVRVCLCVHGACSCEGCAHVCVMWGGCVWMRECVCAPVTMPGRAHHSAGLSPEHMGSCPEGLTCPLPCPPPPGRGASALQAASAPPTRQGTSWSGPGALSP